MGQHNSQLSTPGQQSTLLQNWIHSQKQKGVLVNKHTNQHITRHFVTLPLRDLHHELQLYSTRMRQHRNYIARVVYYHQVTLHARTPQIPQRRNLFVYTDRTLPLRNWGRDNILLILRGLIEIFALYGPFRLSERMIFQNQKCEVKVWLNENPACNHKEDCLTEDQTLADLRGILFKRNQEIAHMLIRCRLLSDAMQRLMRYQNRDFSRLQHNYSYREEDREGFKCKILQKRGCQNVFTKGIIKIKSLGEGLETHKNINKFNHSYNYLPNTNNKFSISDEQLYGQNKNFTKNFFIPSSNSTLKIQAMSNEAKTSNKSTKKLIFVPQQHEESCKQRSPMGNRQFIRNYFTGHSKTGGSNSPYAQKSKEWKLNYKKQTNKEAKNSKQGFGVGFSSNSSLKSQLQQRNSKFNHGKKFQTCADIGFWNKRRAVGGSPCYSNDQGMREIQAANDIKSINNSVSNQIHNTKHKHIAKIRENTQIDAAKTYGVPRSTQIYQLGSEAYRDEKKSQRGNIPMFIKQKKKNGSSNLQASLLNNRQASKSNNILLRKDRVFVKDSSYPQSPSSQVSPLSPGSSLTKKDRELFNYARQENQAQSFVLLGSQNGQGHPDTIPVSSLQKIDLSNTSGYSGYKSSNRTKTTQFNSKGNKDYLKLELQPEPSNAQNNSLMMNEGDKSQNQGARTNIFFNNSPSLVHSYKCNDQLTQINRQSTTLNFEGGDKLFAYSSKLGANMQKESLYKIRQFSDGPKEGGLGLQKLKYLSKELTHFRNGVGKEQQGGSENGNPPVLKLAGSKKHSVFRKMASLQSPVIHQELQLPKNITKSIDRVLQVPKQRVELKKQLRQQFGSLFGEMVGQQEVKEWKLEQRLLAEKKEVTVKEKVEKKRAEFADLKKEVLKVLDDLF